MTEPDDEAAPAGSQALPTTLPSAAGVRPPSGADPGDPFAGLTLLGPLSSERKARDWALVLQSMSLWHVVRRTHDGWGVLVREADYPRAGTAIDRYEVENRDWPPPKTRERPRHAPTLVAPILSLAMIAFFLVTGPVSSASRWFERGSAVTDLVLHAEPWRAATALTLHADGAHVLGNAISGAVFGSAVNRRLGPGGGSLAILLSGLLGNLANAVWHHGMGDAGHGSIGASTAIFGAVGLLAATQVMLDRPVRGAGRTWLELAAPLVGGLALLGELGASPTADLGAHLFGFLAGVGLGLLAAWPLRRRATVDFAGPGRTSVVGGTVAAAVPGGLVQAGLGAVAAGLVLVAWQLALRH